MEGRRFVRRLRVRSAKSRSTTARTWRTEHCRRCTWRDRFGKGGTKTRSRRLTQQFTASKAHWLFLQQMPRDDEVLDLRRPLVNAERTHRAVEPLDGVVVDEAAAAEDLQRLVDDLLRRLRGERLRHGRLHGHAVGAAVLLPERAVDQE